MSITAGLRVFDAGLDRLVTRLPALIGRLAASKCEEYGDVTWRCTRVRVGRPCRRDLRPGLVSLLCGRGEPSPSHMAFPPGRRNLRPDLPAILRVRGNPGSSRLIPRLRIRRDLRPGLTTTLRTRRNLRPVPMTILRHLRPVPMTILRARRDLRPGHVILLRSRPALTEPCPPSLPPARRNRSTVRRDRPSLRPARKGRRGVPRFTGAAARQAQVARHRGESAQRCAG